LYNNDLYDQIPDVKEALRRLPFQAQVIDFSVVYYIRRYIKGEML